MNTLKAVFSTVRFPNLFIICLSLYLIRYTIVKPVLAYSGLTSSITDNGYMLLVLSTLLIAAAGYVINDYHDTEIDAVNKPGKNKIGTVLSNRNALFLYGILNVSGIAGSWYFGYLFEINFPVLVFFLSSGLLYFYSSSYKKMFLTGNIVIALLSALTIGLSILFDKESMISEPVKLLVTAYALFAFLMTWIREIIKDCQDAPGDREYDSHTLPVIAGIKVAHLVSGVLILVLIATIVTIQLLQLQWQNKISFGYTILFIQVPLLVLLFRNFRAKTVVQEKFNSNLAKIIMVTGIFSMLVFQLSSQ